MKEQNLSNNLVMMFFRVTPVPIPNTTVKPLEADGTARETVWESRWSPGPKCSSVAQWWSTRLLTDRLEVRVLSEEPFFYLKRVIKEDINVFFNNSFCISQRNLIIYVELLNYKESVNI